jgi:hypothetical protein
MQLYTVSLVALGKEQGENSGSRSRTPNKPTTQAKEPLFDRAAAQSKTLFHSERVRDARYLLFVLLTNPPVTASHRNFFLTVQNCTAPSFVSTYHPLGVPDGIVPLLWIDVQLNLRRAQHGASMARVPFQY